MTRAVTAKRRGSINRFAGAMTPKGRRRPKPRRSRPSRPGRPRGKSPPPRTGPSPAHRAQKVHNEPLGNAPIISECNRDANFTPFGRTVTALTLGVSYALSPRGTLAHAQVKPLRSCYSGRRRQVARCAPRGATITRGPVAAGSSQLPYDLAVQTLIAQIKN